MFHWSRRAISPCSFAGVDCPSPRENNKLIVRERRQVFRDARVVLKVERERSVKSAALAELWGTDANAAAVT